MSLRKRKVPVEYTKIIPLEGSQGLSEYYREDRGTGKGRNKLNLGREKHLYNRGMDVRKSANTRNNHHEYQTIASNPSLQSVSKLSDTWDKRRSRYVEGYKSPDERSKTIWRDTSSTPTTEYKKESYNTSTKKYKSAIKDPTFVRYEKTPQERQRKPLVKNEPPQPFRVVEKKARFYQPEVLTTEEKVVTSPKSEITPYKRNTQKESTPVPKSVPQEGSNEEIIEKYEEILRSVNSEFKSCLARNKKLEESLEQEQEDRKADQDHIACLRGEIDKVKLEKEHEVNTLPNKEREQYKQQIESLKFQIQHLKDEEERYQSEKANLQLTIENYEITNKKLRDQEFKSQRELNSLIEKLSSKQVSTNDYKLLKQKHESTKSTLELNLTSLKSKSATLASENQNLKEQNLKQNSAMQKLILQVESLKTIVNSQGQNIEIYKRNEEFLRQQVNSAATPLFVTPKPVSFEPGAQMKIIPSPKNSLGGVKSQGNLEAVGGFEDFGGRAGIKPKKHCTINCVFGPDGCERCGNE